MKTDENLESDDVQIELKRCISRLSYVGMGLSQELDAALDSLRTLIKANVSEVEIKSNIDNISKILRTLDDQPVISNNLIEQKEVDIINLFLEQRLPKPLKNKFAEIDQKNRPKDPLQIVQSMAEAIHSYIVNLESIEQDQKQINIIEKEVFVEKEVIVEREKSTEKKPGFFARLFNRNRSPEKETAASKSFEKPVIEKPVIPNELKLSLQQMAEQLASIDNYQKTATQLSDKIARLKSLDELRNILELIADTFVHVSGQEHKQFESFLQSLTKRIDKVNAFIDCTLNYSEKVKGKTIQLDQNIKDNVTSIKLDFDTADSLTEIKEKLYQKLDSIIQRVDDFQAGQQQDQASLKNDLDQLKEQLSATEDETERLKDQLAAQKLKAQTDSLTQLPNRYSYNERLTQEYNRWRRYRSPLSLVIGDIDFFKKINDNYGHDGGDQVLKQVAQFLQSESRESDFIARYGGEEFVILLPETTLIDATKAINKLRQGIKELDIQVGGKKIPVAMSFGVSEFENNDTPRSVFKRADIAIYRAKEKGRDQVCCQRAEPAN